MILCLVKYDLERMEIYNIVHNDTRKPINIFVEKRMGKKRFKLQVPLIIFLVILIAFLAGCNTTPECANQTGIVITEAWAQPSSMQAGDSGMKMDATPTAGGMDMASTPTAGGMDMAAADKPPLSAFMTITNCGKQPDQLLRASSDVAEMIQIHNFETRQGFTEMFEVSKVDLPAGKRVVLKPGSLHIMMMKVVKDVQPGETINLTLEFGQAGKLPVQVTLRAAK